ncbi:MAG: ATP-binding protein [Pseudomonadota bacterium]
MTTAPAPQIDGRTSDWAALYQSRRDALLSDALITSVVVGGAVAPAAAVVFAAEVSLVVAVSWYVTVVAVSIARAGIALHRKKTGRSYGPAALGSLLVFTAIAGGVWAAPLLFATDAISPASEVTTILFTAGMCAGVAVSYATHLSFVAAFNIPALFVIFYYVAARDGGVVFPAVMETMFFGAMLLLAQRSGSKIKRALTNEIAAVEGRSALEARQSDLEQEAAARQASEARLQTALEDTRRMHAALEHIYALTLDDGVAPATFARRVTKTVAETLAASRVSFWIMKDEGHTLECSSLYDAAGDAFESGARIAVPEYPEYFKELKSARVIVASDAVNHPATACMAESYLRPLDIRSVLDAPVRGQSQARGVISCEQVGGSREWTTDEANFTASAAQLLGLQLLADDARALNSALSSALEKSKEANRAKSAFLATMSHEIRTPLNGILGAADILKDMSLTPEMSGFTDIISSSGAGLLTVLNDVLDLSKIEAGKFSIEDADFDLKETVERVAAVHLLKARENSVRLTVDFDESVETRRRGDADRLAQVLHNLSSNAVKFCAKGDITIRVRSSGDDITIEIADTGVGMTAETAERVFAPFEQADSSTTRRHGGTGLGLSIVKGLVEAMGGRIDLATAPGEGSTFTVVLPLRVSNTPQEKGNGASVCKAVDDARVNLQVLVAEDNPTNTIIMDAFLKRAGVAGVFATNGAEAVRLYKERGFDVVLMDIQMPVMDGVEALHAIRDLDRADGSRRAHIVAVTANAMASEVRAYLAHGFDDHLAKPITQAGLEAALSLALTSVRQRPAIDAA